MKTNMILIAAAIMCLSIAIVAAEPVYDAQRSAVGINDTKDANTIESLTASGGNITHVNITLEVSTSSWTGLFGMVTNSLVLEGAGNALFYDWGSQDSTGTVFFSTDNNVDWGNIQGTTSTDNEAEDTALSLTGDPDSVNATFTGTNAAIIAIGGTNIGIGAATAVLTKDNLDADTWETSLLSDGVDYVYATPIQQDTNNYAGNAVDFQTIVPVDGTTYTRTYFIYAAVA